MEEISIKRIAAVVSALLVLAAGMNFVGGMIMTQAEGERAIGAISLELNRFKVEYYSREACDAFTDLKEYKACMDKYHRLAATKDLRTAVELVK